MGAKESKISFLPYEEATKRVTEKELERIRKAFKRYAGNTNVLPKLSFFNEVLGELVPARLGEQLFMTCGGNSKGISFRDVFVLLVLITKGTIDEKVKFLFCLMSVDSNVVTREDLENFYNACDGGGIMPRSICEAFWRHDKLAYDEFQQWVVCNADFSAVTRWLLEEQKQNSGIMLSSDDDTPSFYHSLASITKLTEQDVVELEKRYWTMKALSKTGRFDLDTFTQHVSPPLPPLLCAKFFDFFDQNKDNHVDFKEMVCGISLCCRGLTSERLRACFEMFDANNDGLLCDEETKNMVDLLLVIYKQYDENSAVNAENVIKEIPKSKVGLSFDEFRPWASTSSLIHEFLLLLSQICHIIFGLKPAFQEEEGYVVRRWLEREHKQGLQPGLLYYIITMAWWNSWKKYVNFEADKVVPEAPTHTSSTTWFADVKESPSVGSSVSSINDHAVQVSITNVTMDMKPEKSAKQYNAGNEIADKNTTQKAPGIIDNSSLLGPADTRKLTVLTGEGGKLKQNVVLMCGKDYEVVPEPVWKALLSWYGGNVPLPRTVTVDKDDINPKIELYPIQINLYRHTQPPKSNGFSLNSLGINNLLAQVFGGGNAAANSVEPGNLIAPKRTLQYRASFSHKNTIRQILDFLSNRLKIHVDDLRLWKMENETDLQMLEEELKTVEELELKEGSQVLIEVRNRDLSWPEEMNSLVATRNFRERSNTGLLEKGATGLHNLGNTCFMNSAVQCLSNTKPLTQYFTSKLFTYELNKTNPLGMKGYLAKRYGDLVVDLWNGMYRSIAPVKLRWTIGKYAPRFNGFQQHDSQELLSFLLDGLHEDVNRVHDKPYVELKDSDGRPDSEVADEAWQNHVKRNQSIVVDLFQGQLKSHVRCLHCNHASTRFDPFTFLSLPIPMESSLHIEVPVFVLGNEEVIRYGVLLPQQATIRNLRKELSGLCGVPVEHLLLAEVVGATIRSFLSDEQKVHTNLIGYIYGYEVDGLIDLTTPLKRSDKSNVPNGVATSPTSNTTNVHTTSIGSSDKTNNKQNELNDKQNTPTKSKQKTRHRKIPFRKTDKSSRTKVIEVTSKPDQDTTTVQSSAGVAEVPGIVNTSFSSNNATNSSTSVEFVCESTHHGLVVAMNRKMILSSNYFLSWQKYRPVLFGLPMILSCVNETTNRDVYEKVWKHVCKYVTSDDFDNDNNRVYPFEIKAVDKEGNYCVWCPWYRFCRGCSIPCDDDCFGYTSSCLAIDWDPTILHLHYQQSQEKNFVEDESIENSYKMLREPICLDKCLKDFTKEEELGEDETWYCAKCQEHRTIAKKFDIWKLPPILVIHLKRFQAVNNRWVKSNKVVRFPMKNFDPSMYLAKRKRRKTEDEKMNLKIRKIDVDNTESTQDRRKKSVDISSNISNGCTPLDVSFTSEHNVSPSPPGPLVTSKIQVTESIEDINDIDDAKNNDEDVECLYNLYAISCHSGMLNGGHYITYAKNANGKWYCYNDSSCKEVDESILENESPYMLFYEMKNLNAIDYMPNIKDKQPANDQQDDDEFEKEVKNCSVM